MDTQPIMEVKDDKSGIIITTTSEVSKERLLNRKNMLEMEIVSSQKELDEILIQLKMLGVK